MASTNKTEHIQLNQWVLDDPVLMEDFNMDNQRIEQAIQLLDQKLEQIKSDSLVNKLLDVTVDTGGVKTLELNLAGVNLADYQRLLLTRYGNLNSYIYIRVNKLTGAYQNLASDNVWRAGSNVSCLFEGCGDFWLSGRTVMWSDITASYKPPANMPAQNLNSIDVMTNATASVDFPIGTRFTLVGIKKG